MMNPQSTLLFNLLVFLLVVMLSNISQAETCKEAKLTSEDFAAALEWIKEHENFIDSLLIQHCGEPLIEAYYHGFATDKPHEIQSATKTLSGLLTGIALQQGLIQSMDQRIIELLPDYKPLLTGKKADITVRHLLTMTSGLRWVDFGEGNSFERIHVAEDSVAFILKEPLDSEPGQKFFYNTGSSHLLAAIIHFNSGMPAAAFAKKNLFQPLGISEYSWPRLKDDIPQGGWGVYMLPKDMIKIGQLILDDGVWQGERLMPKEFIALATTGHNPTPYGKSLYGYQIWIEPELGVNDVAAARGWGGQDIFVIDDLDMVVVFTGSIMKPREMYEHVALLMRDYILPAHPNNKN